VVPETLVTVAAETLHVGQLITGVVVPVATEIGVVPLTLVTVPPLTLILVSAGHVKVTVCVLPLMA
jgi:hypothetical protein